MTADFTVASLKMAGSLIFILGLILGLFYLLKRLRVNPLAGSGIPEMRILGTLSLAPKRAVALIEICDQWLIVGIGTENVTLISKIDRPPEGRGPDVGIQTDTGIFQSLLQNMGLRHGDRKKPNTRENAET